MTEIAWQRVTERLYVCQGSNWFNTAMSMSSLAKLKWCFRMSRSGGMFRLCRGLKEEHTILKIFNLLLLNKCKIYFIISLV